MPALLGYVGNTCLLGVEHLRRLLFCLGGWPWGEHVPLSPSRRGRGVKAATPAAERPRGRRVHTPRHITVFLHHLPGRQLWTEAEREGTEWFRNRDVTENPAVSREDARGGRAGRRLCEPSPSAWPLCLLSSQLSVHLSESE